MDLLQHLRLMQDPGEKAGFESALRTAIIAIGADEGSLLLPVENFSQLEFVMCCTRTGINPVLIGQRVPVTEGLVGMAVQSGETQIGAPVFKGVKQAGQASPDKGNPASVLAAPLVHQDAVLGVMTLISFNPAKRFTMADAAQYEALAALVALLLHKQNVINELSGKQPAADADSPEGGLLALVGKLASGSPERIRAVTDILRAIEALK